jgi:hypothetical protein
MAASPSDSYISRRPYVTTGLAVGGVLLLVVATQFVEVLFTVFAGILLAVFLAGVDSRVDRRHPCFLALSLSPSR